MDERKASVEEAVQAVLDEVTGNGLMAGAFGNLHNFLHFVVFYNVTEYFDSCKSDEPDITRRAQSRALFNAVVALDSAADYLFHAESRPGQDVLTFLRNLNEPALLEIREIANALKHCVRRRPEQLHAAQVARPALGFEVDTSRDIAVKLQFSVDFFVTANQSIEKAWQFWFDCAQQIERPVAR